MQTADTRQLSVVLPVYNAAEFLRPAIQSILSQTFDDFELIVIDDGSTDNTAEIGNTVSLGERVRDGQLPASRFLVCAQGTHVRHLHPRRFAER